MSGAGIAADDSGNIFFATGNGTFDTLPPPTDFGDSSMKMALNGSSFTVEDYFTPNDEYLLDIYDLDLSSSGVLLLPDQSGAHVHELVEAGKEGTIYLVDRDDMGEFNPNNKCVQNISGQILAAFSGPAYWNNYVYFGSAGDDGGSPESLKAFSLTNGLLSWPAASATPEQFSYPGPTPSVSANGTSNAIVWALETSPGVPAVLHAYDAGNLGMELYNSNQNRGRDILGSAVKFAVPTIADGKVYVGTVQQVSTYGLLTATTGLTTSLPQGSYVNQSVTFTAAVTTSGPPATGTVTFTSNASPIPECPNPVNVGGTGIAQCVTRSLAIGNDSIKASYSGDQNYSGSSANLIQTVNPIQDFFITSFPTTAVTVTQGYNNVTNPFTVLQSTMTVTTAPLPSTPGFSDPLGVTCTVTPAAGQSVSSQTIPTCVMAPPANNASITCSASTCSFPGQGGMATVTISAGRLTPIGPYAVTITATDQSAPTLFHVTTLSVNVINRSSPVSVPGNASGALVTFAGPINATVTLTATNFNCLLITGSGPGGSIGPGGEDPGQVGISCSLTPASVTLTGTEIAGGLATWTVNVGYNPNVSARLGNPTGIFAAAWLGMPGLLLLGSFNSKQRSRRRTIVQILGTLLILVALLQGVGCGGGGGGSAASGTPAGVYQLLVQGTGSDGATYSAVVPVNVEASGTTSP
jgi:hypothetical protein